MTLRLMGANPCVTLYDGDQATAYASVWRVDWSLRGSGYFHIKRIPLFVGATLALVHSDGSTNVASTALCGGPTGVYFFYPRTKQLLRTQATGSPLVVASDSPPGQAEADAPGAAEDGARGLRPGTPPPHRSGAPQLTGRHVA